MSKNEKIQLLLNIIMLGMVVFLTFTVVDLKWTNQDLENKLAEKKQELLQTQITLGKTEEALKEKESESIKFGIDMIMNHCPDCGAQTEIHTIDNKLYYMECESCSLFCGFYMYLSEDACLQR